MEVNEILDMLDIQVQITVPGWKCQRLKCGWEWIPRRPEKPRICPKCKSPYWDRQRKADKVG